MFSYRTLLVKSSILAAIAACSLSGSFALAGGKGKPYTPPPPQPQIKKIVTTTPFTTLPTNAVVQQPVSVSNSVSNLSKLKKLNGVLNPPKLIPTVPITPPVVLPAPLPAPAPPKKTPVVLEILRELVRLRALQQGGHRPIIVVQPGGGPVVTGDPTQGGQTPPPAGDPDETPPTKADPDETPPTKADPDETPPEAAAASIGNDVELLEVRFVSAGDAKQGPMYRLRVRNNGKADVKQAFNVMLTASLGREPTKESPQAAVKVQGIKAGESINVDVRLPMAAMRMGKNSEGKVLPFAFLFALVDADDALRDRTPDNNLMVMSRLEIAVIEE